MNRRLVLAIDEADDGLAQGAGALAGHLREAGWDVEVVASVAFADPAAAVAVLSRRAPDEAEESALMRLSTADTPLLLLGPTLHAWRSVSELSDLTGVVVGDLVPRHETRVRPGADAAELAERLGGDTVLTDRWPLVDKVHDDVEVLLTANVHLADHPVSTLRRARSSVATLTLGADRSVLTDPRYLRLVNRVLRRLVSVPRAPDVGVGLLGYGAIGSEHDAAVAAVDGLNLTAVCDRNPSRAALALARTPAARAVDAEALLAADDVDVVVVSTPPNSHAEWALRALRAGKHVVVEKPFCLVVAEADELMRVAQEVGRLVVVYQNRRWDRDFLALRAAVRSGTVGELFHLESFVGGYAHPCNYWHSDEAVSGGAIYDWGSHHLDWTLDLFPQPVEWVSATAHKRVWHDVSNADHTRVLLHFADGAEAEFTHSDIAAALKPKWYALGTRGAIRGDWRNAAVVSRDDVGNLREDALAPAESPALLTVLRPGPDGGVSEERLALPPAPAQPFHRELADRLILGEPMTVSAAQSRRGVAVMEAASESARAGGRQVAPPA